MIASSEALQQGENISIVISEIINTSCDIELSNDNAAALHMVRYGSETAWRTRHISVKALWLHQMSRRGIKLMSLLWVKTPSGMIESKPSMDGIRSPDPRKARMPGHGKAKTIKNGLLPEVLPRETRAFQPIQQIVQTQMKGIAMERSGRDQPPAVLLVSRQRI